MTTFKAILLAAASTAGLAGFGTVAEAQYYGQPPQGYYYRQPQPQYVDPRIQRKQLQQQKRFIQKYGYPVQQQPNYGYYQQPQYYQPQPRYVQPQYGYQYQRQQQPQAVPPGFTPGGGVLMDR